ncbi:unnamed protein product [Scytosiphon promiscuus]
MFVSRSPGERFLPDQSRAGPELRQALDLFRVINRTGLQIREGVDLDSDPCGRLYAGDVFCVNRSVVIAHDHNCINGDKQRKRRLQRLTRLHLVQPHTGWVSGSSKWVERFQEGGSRPGPVPLRSTLSDNCPVLMVKSMEGNSVTPRLTSSTMVALHPRMQGTPSYQDSNPIDADRRLEPRALTPRTKWLHSRGGVWPVAVSSIPGPKYFPNVSVTTRDETCPMQGVAFPKEKRFLSNAIRYLSRGHEREAQGLCSPGPATYRGHDDVIMMLAPRPPPPSSAPGSSRRRPHASMTRAAGKAGQVAGGHVHKSLRTRRAATADPVTTRGERKRRALCFVRATIPMRGAPYIGLKEQEAAEKLIGPAKAGTTGSPVMRLLFSSRGEREGPDGCFVTRLGAASPGPARHFPDVSSISPRGCPVFAAPMALDPKDWDRKRQAVLSKTVDSREELSRTSVRPKTCQVHRRWPSHTHIRDEGRISGNLGQDSPGPGTVNVASHDPFRTTSFLKTDVCCPPRTASPASFTCRVPFG